MQHLKSLLVQKIYSQKRKNMKQNQDVILHFCDLPYLPYHSLDSTFRKHRKSYSTLKYLNVCVCVS